MLLNSTGLEFSKQKSLMVFKNIKHTSLHNVLENKPMKITIGETIEMRNSFI